MAKIYPRILSLLVGASMLLSPLSGGVLIAHSATLPAGQVAPERQAQIFLVDPSAATADVISIAVRGSDWGPYDDRGTTHAWLVDQETNQMYELKIDRNYRDCMFSVNNGNLTGGCSSSMQKNELFLRLVIPDELKLSLQPKTYVIYVRTDNNIYGGAPFTLLGKPTFNSDTGARIAVAPQEGPYGTYAVLFGAGFPKGQGLNVRFDGVRVSVGGYLAPNPDGTFDNVGFYIPVTLKGLDGKTINVTVGKHTIEVSNDNPQNMAKASTIFTIIDKAQTDADKKKQQLEEQKKKDEALKKEQQLKADKEKADKEQALLEQQRKDLEKQVQQKQDEQKKQQDTVKKEQLLKEQQDLAKKLADKKKQEQQKEQKVEDIKKKQSDLADTFCDASLPITFQPGCIQKVKTNTKSKYDGLPCDADIAITFQPGCIAQKPIEQISLFKGKPCSSNLPITFQPGCISSFPTVPVKQYSGKPCDPNLPRVWQEGCVDASIKTGLAPSGKQYCDPTTPSYSQPGCVPQPEKETVRPFGGKPCDPNLPRVWQEGCQEKAAPLQQPSPNTSSVQVSPSPSAPTPLGTKCDPAIPHYSQPNCTE